MWVLRIVLSFLFVIFLGRQIPKIVHNLTPFKADGYDGKNITCKFVRSRMNDFFEYQISYNISVPVNRSEVLRAYDMFWIGDIINNKMQFDLHTGKRIVHNVFNTTHNITINTVSVPPLFVKGGFLLQTGDPRQLIVSYQGFQLEIPGAEPLFNPLLASLVIIYVLIVIFGYTMETLAAGDYLKKSYNVLEDEKEGNRTPAKRNLLPPFLSWIVVVALIEGLVIFVAIKSGVVPSNFH